MEVHNYAKIVTSLNVRPNHVEHVQVNQPVKITDYKNVNNKIVVVNKGQISWNQGDGKVTMQEGDMFFLPELSPISITYGAHQPITIDNNQFTNYQEQYLEIVDSLEEASSINGSFSCISFNAKVYEAIDLFKFVNIPAFKIKKDTGIHTIFQNIITETQQNRLGKERVLQNLTECLVIELIRHIIENTLFIDQLVLKAAALTDLRLATLFKYIASNVPNDLSNKVMAREVGLSKDYIGQYFKNITDMNLQRYIETIRLNRAVELLKNNPNMKIRDVAVACGFSDLAYFCRKFKTLWGTTARKMRTVLDSRGRR